MDCPSRPQGRKKTLKKWIAAKLRYFKNPFHRVKSGFAVLEIPYYG